MNRGRKLARFLATVAACSITLAAQENYCTRIQNLEKILDRLGEQEIAYDQQLAELERKLAEAQAKADAWTKPQELLDAETAVDQALQRQSAVRDQLDDVRSEDLPKPESTAELRAERDSKKAAYDQAKTAADEARRAIRSSERYDEKMREYNRRRAAAVSKVGGGFVQALTDNPALAGDVNFSGDPASSLGRLVARARSLASGLNVPAERRAGEEGWQEEEDRMRTQAGIVSNQDRAVWDQLLEVRKPLSALRAQIQSDFEQIRRLREDALPAAEEAGKLNLTKAQQDALDQEESLRASYETAQSRFERAEQQAAAGQQRIENRTERVADLERTLQQTEQDLDAKRAALATLKAGVENPQTEANAARQRRDEAKANLETVRYDLQARRTELGPLKTQMAGVYDRIGQGYRAGSQALQQAGAAHKAGDDNACLTHLRTARDQLSAARALSNGNRACLEKEGRDVERVTQALNARLAVIERQPCSGAPLDQDVVVPDVTGRPLSEAMSTLTAAGFNPRRSVAAATSDVAQAGTVSGQNPAGGSTATQGTAVDLNYYNELVEVPDVRGRDAAAADTILAGLGLFGNLMKGEPTGDMEMVGIVYQQGTAPGQKVLAGAVVNLIFHAAPWEPSPSESAAADADADDTADDAAAPTAADADADAADAADATDAGDDSEAAAALGELDHGEPDEAPTFPETPGVDPSVFLVDPEPMLDTEEPLGSPPPSGWARAGELETIDGEPAAAPTPTPPAAPTPAPAAETPPPAPTSPPDYLAGQAEAAARSCDYSSAMSWARDLQQQDPGHPWLQSRFPAVQDEARRHAAAQQAFNQAQATLQSGEPNEATAQQAIAQARRAQAVAPDCLSEQVAGLNGPIDQVMAAIRARNRTSFSQGLSSLLQGVTMAANSISASRGGYSPPAIVNPGTGGVAGDLAGALGAVSAAQGAGAGPVSTPAGGAAVAGASSGSQAQCDVCMIIDRGGFSSVADGYFAFETVISYPQAQCGGNARARVYETIPISGDPEEQAEGAANYIRAASAPGRSVRKLCGPCGSASQASSLLRRRCPNPSHNVLQGLGGTTLNGRPVPQ